MGERLGLRLAAAFLVFVSFSARAESGPEPMLPAGELPQLSGRSADASFALPLRHTDVRAEISGPAARVTVTQVYGNDAAAPIEAIYVFPLPENAAVDDFELRVGQRVVRAEIRERERARKEYEAARRAGQTAALLEQERSNVFTQSVANLAPGEEIRVVVRYAQTLAYDDGSWEFSFPMVVGPRYSPGSPLPESAGQGTAPDTDRVPDASRISPVYLPARARDGHDVSLSVTLDAGLPVRAFETPTHAVAAQSLDGEKLRFTLVESDSIPNRDFVLRWSVAGEQPAATLLTHQSERGGFFTLLVQPPELDVEAEVGRREILFVVDNSGSMYGPPLWLCQQAMRSALSKLRPVDTFDLLTFSGSTRRAFGEPRPATAANVEQAMQVVAGMHAGGGTELRGAVDAAFSRPVEPGRRRYVFFLTDGFVGNEAEIIAAARSWAIELERRGERGRAFAMGVGSSPNRYLIDGLAEAGMGVGVYVTNREDPARAVNQFFRKIDRPILEDVSIDWGGLRTSELSPSPLPDLFASRPLVIHGRYQGSGRSRIVVRGYGGGRKVEIPLKIELSGEPHGDPLIASLWARSRVGELVVDRDLARFERQEREAERLRGEIVELGLAYRLMTPFTSFVAVDRSRVVGDGSPETVAVPAHAPEDVDLGMAGGTVVTAGLLGTQGFVGFGAVGTGKGGGGSGVGDSGGFGTIGLSIGTRGRGGGMGATGQLWVPELKPSPSVVAVAAEGADVALMRQVIVRNLGQLQYCERSSRGTAGEAFVGQIEVRIVLKSDGDVEKVELVQGKPSAKLAECLLTRARTWKFPKPRSGGRAVVEVTLSFTAAGG